MNRLYKDLSPSTKNRLVSLTKKLHDNGFTITQAKKMSNTELKNALQSKAKSMEPTKRLLKQITFDKERRMKVRNDTLISYKNKGYNPNRIDDLRKDLTLTTGSSFFAISNELKKEYGISQKESYKLARTLMKTPKSKYKKLKKVQRDILLDFESP